MENVDIVIATYNGAPFLPTLLDSILGQPYRQIHLIIRDDGSTDSTALVLKNYAEQHPGKITIVNDFKGNLGVISNFSELISLSKAPYVFLSDQDDQWLPHKVEKTMELLKQMEKEYGSETPLLAHSDLTVVDQELKEIHPSFWGYSNLNPDNSATNRLLVQNFIAGCTMGMNRKMAELIPPIPNDVMMHDWWIALAASCFGKIGRLDQSTILYRQHGGSTLGAQKFQWHRVFTVFFMKSKGVGEGPRKQAASLLQRFKGELKPAQKKMIQAYVDIKDKSYFRQRIEILKYGFYRHGFLRSIRTILRPFEY